MKKENIVLLILYFGILLFGLWILFYILPQHSRADESPCNASNSAEVTLVDSDANNDNDDVICVPLDTPVVSPSPDFPNLESTPSATPSIAASPSAMPTNTPNTDSSSGNTSTGNTGTSPTITFPPFPPHTGFGS